MYLKKAGKFLIKVSDIVLTSRAGIFLRKRKEVTVRNSAITRHFTACFTVIGLSYLVSLVAEGGSGSTFIITISISLS